MIKQRKRPNTASDGVVIEKRTTVPTVLVSAVDYAYLVSVVLGGCCSNVWAYEHLLRTERTIGPALTFVQMTFIALARLPAFLDRSETATLPRLKPRAIPLRTWAAQVVVFAGGSVLNNAAYAFDVPLAVQIVFRSAGLAVSMVLGRTVLGRRYSPQQTAAVMLVTAGVLVATLSRSSASADSASTPDPRRYALGVSFLLLSLVLTGVLGLLQERAYAKYGPHWQEGVFYTHALSLPVFIPLAPTVVKGMLQLGKEGGWFAYGVLGANLLSQLMCVSAVNRLSSRVSAVSTQVVLTARKALSLCFSVWWFKNGWNARLAVGAAAVFAGSAWYSLSPSVATLGHNKPEPATKQPKTLPEEKQNDTPSQRSAAPLISQPESVGSGKTGSEMNTTDGKRMRKRKGR